MAASRTACCLYTVQIFFLYLLCEVLSSKIKKWFDILVSASAGCPDDVVIVDDDNSYCNKVFVPLYFAGA